MDHNGGKVLNLVKKSVYIFNSKMYYVHRINHNLKGAINTMGIRSYTIAEFRKNTKEAFDNADEEGMTFITRHGIRYELRRAAVQNGKTQLKEDTIPEKKISRDADASVVVAQDTKALSVEYILSWNYDGIGSWSHVTLSNAAQILQKALDTIDIDTQDPDEVEHGATLAAHIDLLKQEAKKRGLI